MIMKRAWSDGRVRIGTVSAVVLAASAMSIVPAVRTGPAGGCTCHIGRSCASMSPQGGMAVAAAAPPPGERAAREGHSSHHAAAVQRQAISLPGHGDGIVLKFSLYRGLGGGVTSSFTKDGLAFTLESGAGVGGSFSVGSTMGRPDVGPGLEARASMSSRLRLIRPPDFGLTVSRDGTLQAYVDAKTGNFRTRFRSKSMSLTGDGVKGKAEAPATRRSWSLGTEFKLAGTYTVRVPWGGIFDVWRGMFGPAPGVWNSRAPPTRSVDLLGYVAVLGRAVFRRSFDGRPHDAARRRGRAGRFPGSRMFRALGVLRVVRAGRRARFRRPRGVASQARAPRKGPRGARPPAAPEDEEPA
jgi:hypothetical protein